jgi:hypothetical protein
MQQTDDARGDDRKDGQDNPERRTTWIAVGPKQDTC